MSRLTVGVWIVAASLASIVSLVGVAGAQVELQPRMGDPVRGLTPAEMQRFLAGRVRFSQVFTAAEGLGPTFNNNSCAACHNNPLGGSGTITVTRFGTFDALGDFDPLAALGGSLLQSQATSPACLETVPAAALITAQRVTTPTLGSGLVEAIADADIVALAMIPSPTVSGAVHMVAPLEDPGGALRVGRFGWKSQIATVLSFSGDAAAGELGITNRLVGQEQAPNGNVALLATCDPVPDPEDVADAEGLEFIDRITDFQRLLAPPPQTPRSGMTGETVFNAIGCADCHVPSFTTANDPALEGALRARTIRPYSDFLLHDMGQAADFIAQGGAGDREMRTPPLWGLRGRDPLWHDGRVAGGTFENRIAGPGGAIAQHDAFLSEAQTSAQLFSTLSPSDRSALVRFLASLGRAEFDADGDHDVDYDDLVAFRAARAIGGPFTPDDPEAVFDIDQDQAVGAADFAAFILAFDVDCNGNGTSDLADILIHGTSFDANGNLIPDECEFCQVDLGFGGPAGTLSLSICGDDLSMPGTRATLLIEGAAPGQQVIGVASTYAHPETILGGGILVPGPPYFILGPVPATPAGRVVATLHGGPTAVFILQAAVVFGTTVELSNAVQLVYGY